MGLFFGSIYHNTQTVLATLQFGRISIKLLLYINAGIMLKSIDHCEDKSMCNERRETAHVLVCSIAMPSAGRNK